MFGQVRFGNNTVFSVRPYPMENCADLSFEQPCVIYVQKVCATMINTVFFFFRLLFQMEKSNAIYTDTMGLSLRSYTEPVQEKKYLTQGH